LALEASKRDAERRIVLQVLELYPSLDALKVAVKAAKSKDLKEDATRASMVIAQKLGGKDGAAELLAQLGRAPVKLEILKAEYGAGDKQKDVTDVVRKAAQNLPLVVLPAPSYNASFGGDPAPNVPKQLRVRYRMNGVEAEASFAENAVILLPMVKAE
jgi:hypothetical protein